MSDTKNHWKLQSVDVAKKWVETYSSSNKAAQHPKKKVTNLVAPLSQRNISECNDILQGVRIPKL